MTLKEAQARLATYESLLKESLIWAPRSANPQSSVSTFSDLGNRIEAALANSVAPVTPGNDKAR